MDQPLTIDIAERHRALEAQLDDQLERLQLVGAAVRPQCAALDVLHHDVGFRRVGDGVEDLHHVRVLQAADERRLGGKEALVVAPVLGIGERAGADALDRHIALQEVVPAEKDLARRTLAEAAQHAVLADARRQFGQRGKGDGG